MSLRVYHSANEYVESEGGPCAATLGTFDGFHLGHAALFDRLIDKAKALNLPPVAITFHPHPRVLVTPQDPPQLLSTPEEKIELLSQPLDGSLVFLPFDEHLRQMTADRFAREVLADRFGVKAFVFGYNHSFGRDRLGNADTLKGIGDREGFEVEIVPPVTYAGMPISL